jgi:NAD(P) transhydrogenase subunit alpha
MEHVDPTVFRLAIFVLSIFVGYYVVWTVTNAISSVIIVGGLIAAAAMSAQAGGPNAWIAKGAGVAAVTLASVNIFGGFMVTRRMLAMYKKKERA